jgi:guanidinoacetate N-methyltransferase
MVLINAFWQDAVPLLQEASFDGILFDSIELDKEPHLFNSFPFFAAAHRLLRPGGVFTYFSDEPTELSERHLSELRAAGFGSIDWQRCPVQPPAGCRYWHDDTIVAPIIIR